MSDADRAFLALYRTERVEDQRAWFARKAAWHRGRADLLIVLTAVTLAASSAVALLGAKATGWAWPVAAALLPAVAAALASVRSLYEFERNHDRFQTTAFDLERVAAETEPPGDLEGPELREALERYVAEVEGLLARENQQWLALMASGGRRDAPPE